MSPAQGESHKSAAVTGSGGVSRGDEFLCGECGVLTSEKDGEKEGEGDQTGLRPQEGEEEIRPMR